MSVSKMAVSQGSVVRPDKMVMTASRSIGRLPRPCARSVSATIHIVSADCTTSTGQKASGTPANEDEAVDHGAARHQVALVPAREIAAGVVLQEGKAVPQRRRDQQRQRQYDGKRPQGALARKRRILPAVLSWPDLFRPSTSSCYGTVIQDVDARVKPGHDDRKSCATMFVTFFHELKSAGVPVTLREYLTLMQAMQADLASRKVEDFYYLSRATLVKDERNLDKFDRVFGHVFKGLEFRRRRRRGADPRRVAEEARGEISHRRREKADRGHGRARQAARNAEASGSPSRRAVTRAARNGSAPAAPRRLATAATIRKASASAAKARTSAR